MRQLPLTHYRYRFYRLLTYLSIPGTCIWLLGFFLFRTLCYSQVAHSWFRRYTFPARFEEHCWNDTWCRSCGSDVNAYAGWDCHSLCSERRIFFRFGNLWFLFWPLKIITGFTAADKRREERKGGGKEILGEGKVSIRVKWPIRPELISVSVAWI